MNRRFLFVFPLFAILYLIFTILGFAQTPTPTTSSIYNVFGTGDNDHDGRADDLTVSATVNANPVKTSLSQTASAGQKAVFIGGASGFAQKDEVAIIQMQGTNAGTWETAFVTDTRPKGRLLLNRTLTNTYTVDASSKTQVVRIPHYRNVRVQSGGVLAVDPWDGSSGGVMFLRAQNDLDVRNGGKIDVSGKGFRGGQQPADTACGSFFCSAGTQCDVQPGSDGVPMYSCIPSSTTQQLSSEGPGGNGGQQGERGNDGWPGVYTDNKVSSSNEVYHGDGGGGGGAGGGGGGGGLTLGATDGPDGGSGTYGKKVTGDCSGQGGSTESTYSLTGEKVLSWQWRQGPNRCENTCQKFKVNGELLSSINNSDSCSYPLKQYGPPGRGRPGGSGGATNTLPAFSGSQVFLGAGGGSGGAGGLGGLGGRGGFPSGGGGQNGSGGSGGNGGGTILLFAKTISVSGEVISNGGVGQNGQNGGRGSDGVRNGDNYPGGGGGGAGGAGGGGGSGGTVRFYGERVSLGNSLTKAIGGTGGIGGSGAIGGNGTTFDPDSGDSLNSGGTGGGATTIRGGSGSKGAVFVTFTSSFSGTSASLVSANQVSEIIRQ